MQHRPWPSRAALSSGPATVERFLARAGFDRGPWLAVAFAAGIGLWFMLDDRWQWAATIAFCLGIAVAGRAAFLRDGDFPHLRQAFAVVPAVVACGIAVIWMKSAMVGMPPVDRPLAGTFTATLLDREERPSEQRVRLILAIREPQTGRALRVRLNLPASRDSSGLTAGARLRFRARLMPPAPPMLPGGYDFARTAWFGGLGAVGNVLGPVEIVGAGDGGGVLKRLKAALSAHVRGSLDGSSGAIAAALASGDRGAIAPNDDQAMRDAGLAHLLSISGLHVSAVVAAAYFVALKLLALSGWLALRVRLPLLAACAGALSGIGYTLLTGAEVPTVRSCVGAVLVLLALALGREPLSTRMVAVAAIVVMLLWPEAIAGPSFQMSFAAVIAIVALHGAAPIRAFLAPKEEAWVTRMLRRAGMLLLTGVVIELALMPIGLFHFHRAGLYGALANVVAIPLTTIVSMPLIATALLLDVAGAGAPFWWLAGKSIDVILALAHWISARPGAVTMSPAVPATGIVLLAAGGLWLALWRGRVRLLGLLPIIPALLMLLAVRPPDLLVSGDGRHVGITHQGVLYTLRTATGFAGENLAELAGLGGAPRPLAAMPGARCTGDFCVVELTRGGRHWRLLIAKSRDAIAERHLAAACARTEIVIADRWLPHSCRPAILKIDRRLLARTGGLTLDFRTGRLHTVASQQGGHGWWRPARSRQPAGKPPRGSATQSLPSGVQSSPGDAQPWPSGAQPTHSSAQPAPGGAQ